MAPEAVETNSVPSKTSGVLDATSSPDSKWTPHTVLATIPAVAQPPKAAPSSPVAFFHILERLKTTKREGWRRFGISRGESISDHMYRMSIITMLCPQSLAKKLDLARCTKMALVHDMAELLVGDITPVDGVSKSEKSRRESETMDYLCDHMLGGVDGGAQAREIREVWQEYEDSQTPESIFVHDVDKMELILQMLDYEKSGKGELDLGEFSHVATRIVMPEVKAWCDEVLEERKSFWMSHGKVASQPPSSKERETQLNEYYKNGHSNGTANK